GIADHREGRQHVPDRTPVRGPDTPSAADGGVEEDVRRIGRGGGGGHANSDQRIDGKIHVGALLHVWRRDTAERGFRHCRGWPRNPSSFATRFLQRRWMRGSSPRMTRAARVVKLIT